MMVSIDTFRCRVVSESGAFSGSRSMPGHTPMLTRIPISILLAILALAGCDESSGPGERPREIIDEGGP